MVNKSKEDLKKELSSESYYVTQENGTERPFTGQFWDHFENILEPFWDPIGPFAKVTNTQGASDMGGSYS